MTIIEPASRPQPDFFLVIDVEATCDDRGAVPKTEMEVIEIGAVLVDAVTLEPVDEFTTFVRPVRHPVLTTFCTALTTITQAQVAAASRFPGALEALRRFIGERNALFSSWGEYDRRQFERDAHYHRVTLPFRGGHLNIKQKFSDALGETKKLGMDGALERVGLAIVGTHHRGIDDARNIARLLPWAFGRVSAPSAPAASSRERKRGRAPRRR